MTVRDELHQLVATLPDDDLGLAQRYLEALRDRRVDPMIWALDNAPIDDEPTTPEEEAAVAEALEDIRQGRTVSLEEARRVLLS